MNIESFLNSVLMPWKLGRLKDEELLVFVTEKGKIFPQGAYEFMRLMVTYAIGYGFKEEDLLPMGGIEST
jgi:hypothetical protein